MTSKRSTAADEPQFRILMTSEYRSSTEPVFSPRGFQSEHAFSGIATACLKFRERYRRASGGSDTSAKCQQLMDGEWVDVDLSALCDEQDRMFFVAAKY